MSARSGIIFVCALAVTGLLFPGGAAIAQDANASHVHVGHVTDGWGDTPDGQGLLPTAIAEAEVAAQHAELAASDPDNLEAVKLHVGHVLHAIAPEAGSDGPGLGYGLKQAAEGTVTHIELAAEAEGASENVVTHATHVATSARNTIERADEIVMLAEEIQAASSAADAAALVERLNTLASQLIPGVDADGDGQIGWQEGEGGLQQAEQHATLLKQGENIS